MTAPYEITAVEAPRGPMFEPLRQVESGGPPRAGAQPRLRTPGVTDGALQHGCRRTWWSKRSLMAVRWLVDHGFDPSPEGPTEAFRFYGAPINDWPLDEVVRQTSRLWSNDGESADHRR